MVGRKKRKDENFMNSLKKLEEKLDTLQVTDEECQLPTP